MINDPLFELVSRCVGMESYEIDIEYKDGYEEVFAIKNEVGFGIARLDSSSEEASRLREQLHALTQSGKNTIRQNETEFKLEVTLYDSFGEDAFHLKITKR